MIIEMDNKISKSAITANITGKRRHIENHKQEGLQLAALSSFEKKKKYVKTFLQSFYKNTFKK